jgi:Arc/MetJ family transcription regulator
LTNASKIYIFILYICTFIVNHEKQRMRTRLNIEEQLIHRASKLTGVKEKTSLVRMGLESLIAMESARRLAKLGGTKKSLKPVPRRRPNR